MMFPSLAVQTDPPVRQTTYLPHDIVLFSRTEERTILSYNDEI